MMITHDSLGSPLSAPENSNVELPPDIWCYSGFMVGSPIRSAFVFTFSKTNRGRLRESLIFLSLTSGPVFAGQLRTTDVGISELLESLGNGLNSLLELDEGSLTRLLCDLENCLEYNIRSLSELPEQAIGERIAIWRHSRLVELSQSGPRAEFVDLQRQVENESVLLSRHLMSMLQGMKQNDCCALAQSEQKLPQLSWVQIQNYLAHTDPLIARNRRQAIGIFPALIGIAIQNAGGPFCTGLRDAVDCGLPLVDYIVSCWQVRAVAVRGLREQGFDALGVNWADAPRALLHILSAIAPEKYPRTPGQWRVFTEQAQLFSVVLRQPLAGESVRLFMHEASRRNWVKSGALHSDLIQQAHTFEAFAGDLGRAVRVWNIGELRGQPAGQVRFEDHQLLTTLMLSVGVAKLIRIAQQWQSHRAKSEVPQRIGDLRFPALLSQPFVMDGLQIVQLCSASELESESSAMRHCVDTFVANCRTGKSLIFSIRALSGDRFSTFELSIKNKGNDGFDIRLIQHKGPNNRVPQSGAAKALGRFLEHLKIGASRHVLQRYDQERRVFNHDPALANDFRMAHLLKDFLSEQTKGRVFSRVHRDVK